MLYGSIDFQKPLLEGCEEPHCWTLMTNDGEWLTPVFQKHYPAESDYAAINALYACNEPGFFTPKKEKKEERSKLEKIHKRHGK